MTYNPVLQKITNDCVDHFHYINNTNSNKNNMPTFGSDAQHRFINFPTLGGQFDLKNKGLKHRYSEPSTNVVSKDSESNGQNCSLQSLLNNDFY